MFRKALITLLLLVISTSSRASSPAIGLYYDELCTVRCYSADPFSTTTLYLAATNVDYNIIGWQCAVWFSGSGIITNSNTFGGLNIATFPDFDVGLSSADSRPSVDSVVILATFDLINYSSNTISLGVEPYINSSVPHAVVAIPDGHPGSLVPLAPTNGLWTNPCCKLNGEDWFCYDTYDSNHSIYTCFYTSFFDLPSPSSHIDDVDFGANIGLYTLLSNHSVIRIDSTPPPSTYTYTVDEHGSSYSYSTPAHDCYLILDTPSFAPSLVDSLIAQGYTSSSMSLSLPSALSSNCIYDIDDSGLRGLHYDNSYPYATDLQCYWHDIYDHTTSTPIGVLDTAVPSDPNYSEMYGRLLGQVADEWYPVYLDHGSKVTSVLAGAHDGAGINGIIPNPVYFIQTAKHTGPIYFKPITHLIDEFPLFADNGCKAVNISAGYAIPDIGAAAEICNTFSNYHNSGGTIIAASNNVDAYSAPFTIPQVFWQTVVVAQINEQGLNPGGKGPHIDFCAPGASIYAQDHLGNYGLVTPGASFAAPLCVRHSTID